MALTKTKIPYLTHTWPVVTGCSFGCPECWARRIANRFGNSFEPTFHPDRLRDPAKRKKPAIIGVAFGGDLFDPALVGEPDAIAETFYRAYANPRHTYVFLTKRVKHMALTCEWWTRKTISLLVQPNWYMGVTVRNQAELDAAAPHIRAIAAAGWKVWLSIEPIQGPVDLLILPLCTLAACNDNGPRCDNETCPSRLIQGVILGGQSGPGAPPLHPDWVRSVRDQCATAGVAFMFKQWADRQNDHEGYLIFRHDFQDEGEFYPVLDGRTHTALPWGKVEP